MSELIHLRGGTGDDAVSVLVAAEGSGGPCVVHWGEPLEGAQAAPALKVAWGGRLAEPPPLSLMCTEGQGWFGEPALSLHPDGAAWLDLKLDGFEAANDAVRATLRDVAAGLTVELRLLLDAETGVLVSRATLRSDRAVEVRWLASACWPLPERAGEMLTLSGAWADEFRTHLGPCPPGLFERGSRRGRSSHEGYPGLVVGEAGFGEDHGEVWGATLGWSGDHRMLLEPLDDGGRQMQLGVRLAPGELVVRPGQPFETPPAYAAYSARGLNGLRRKLHAHARRRVLPAGVAKHSRPVTLNTWEAMYFAQSEAKVLALAEDAAALGVERFVVDDGWFVGRRDDERALGDWTVDAAKYPRGLAPVAERVHALGMQFGLWVEPEGVSPDSELHRAHPDWALSDAGREPRLARHQLLLDLTRPDVAEHLFATLDRLLRETPIDYLKWDMNRPLTDAATVVNGVARPAHRAYTVALHALIDRVRAAHPGVEIEACASGGGRADWGMLARSERVWTSDNLDPLDRLRIQEGASLFLPPEVMGAHVGARRAHVTGRETGLDFRTHVAMFGAFGVEAAPAAMDARDRDRLAAHIAQHKRLRPLIHGQELFHVKPDADHVAVVSVSEGRDHALLGLYRTGSGIAGRPTTVRLRALDPAATYTLRLLQPVDRGVTGSLIDAPAWLAGEVRQSGSALAALGLTFQLPRPLTSLLLELTRVESA